jgi:hypothetical protein
MRLIAGTLVLMACSQVAPAGDSLLLITNHPEQACGNANAPAVTKRTGKEVAASLAGYFAGDPNGEGASWFSNGHFRFCGREERGDVYSALVNAALPVTVRHEAELIDLVGLIASSQLRGAIDKALADTGTEATARRRLERMRAEVDDGLRRRRTRG